MKTAHIALAAVLLMVLGICAYTESAEKAADADKGASSAQDLDNAPAPKYITDIVDIKDGKSVASGKPALSRFFFDLFYGSVKTADDDVSASSSPGCVFSCPPSTNYGRHARFDTSSVFGVRFGSWFESLPAVGLGLDVSYLIAEAPRVSIWYMPFSFVVLARYQLLRTDRIPEGQLQLYGGLMASWVIGDIQVGAVGGSSYDNFGYGTLLGAAWHFPSFAILGEYRMMRASVSYETGEVFGGSASASADLDTKQMLLGVSFKF